MQAKYASVSRADDSLTCRRSGHEFAENRLSRRMDTHPQFAQRSWRHHRYRYKVKPLILTSASVVASVNPVIEDKEKILILISTSDNVVLLYHTSKRVRLTHRDHSIHRLTTHNSISLSTSFRRLHLLHL